MHIKTIVFTGDSHTWGEGSAKSNPPDYFGDGAPAVAGDLRRMRADYPSFVSLISNWLSGKYRVINSGIGSCPTFKYLDEYWDGYVVSYDPEIIVIQPHTINDWLTGEGPDIYRNHLERYIGAALKITKKIILTTVSPVLGEQTVPGNPGALYADYIDQIYIVGKSRGIKIADVYPKLSDPSYFSDIWHVNIKGHKIYADTIMEILREMI